MGREEVTWQLQTKEHNEVSDIRGSCPILDDKRRLCRGLISREGQRGRPQGRRPERGPCPLMPDPAGSTRDPLTEGASEGGPRLSAPTDPCLPQCVLPCLSPEAKHPGPEPADHPPGPTEMLPGGRYSPRRARGGSTARVKQPPHPANTPCPRRAALQRPGQTLRPPALPPAFQRMLTHARAHTHTHAHAHTHTVHAHTHAHTLAAGIHVPATATQSRVELLPITRQCLEGVPAQLQSLRDPRRPGIAPGWVKDPVGGSRWASPGASCLSPDADPRPRSHGSPLPQGTQHFILPKCGQQSSPTSLSPIIKRRS